MNLGSDAEGFPNAPVRQRTFCTALTPWAFCTGAPCELCLAFRVRKAGVYEPMTQILLGRQRWIRNKPR